MEHPKHEIKVGKPHRDWFNKDEWELFYKCFPSFIKDSGNDKDRYYRKLIRDFVLIAANSCCRVGELRQLEWNMVSSLWVNKTERDGSIGKRDFIEFDIPARITKTNTSRQFVTRGGKYLERIEFYYPHDITDNGFVFSHYNNNEAITYRTLAIYWKKLVDYSGIEQKTGKHYVLYSLRHYGITHRLANGVDTYIVAKGSGTSLHFIEKHYEHLELQISRNAALQEAGIGINDPSIDDR